MKPARLPDHPDAEKEYCHLQETCDAIEREIGEVEALTGAKAGECMDVQMEEDPDQQEEVTMQLFRYELSRLHQLDMARGQAYFARLDFTARGGGKRNLLPGALGRTEPGNAGSGGDRLAFTGGEPVLFRPDRRHGLRSAGRTGDR